MTVRHGKSSICRQCNTQFFRSRVLQRASHIWENTNVGNTTPSQIDMGEFWSQMWYSKPNATNLRFENGLHVYTTIYHQSLDEFGTFSGFKFNSFLIFTMFIYVCKFQVWMVTLW